MARLHPLTRSGISQTKLVIVIIAVVGALGILAVLFLGMIGVAVFEAQDGAKRKECRNRIRNLGFALHIYQDDFRGFPAEGKPGAPSFYVSILDYVEEQNMDPNNPRPVKLFLCPSRRNTSVGPKRDYGYGKPAAGTAILGAGESVPIKDVSITNGIGKTAILAHIWMAPSSYFSGMDPNWNESSNSAKASMNNIDTNPAGAGGMGSPHPIHPFLFADGHIQNIPYEGPLTQHLDKIWSYDNTQPFDLDY